MFSSKNTLISCLFLSSCTTWYYRLGSEKIKWDQEEYEFVNEFFMGTIDLDKVNLHYAGWDNNDGTCFALNNDIYFNALLDYEADPKSFRSTLIHELSHVWQNQNFSNNAFELDPNAYVTTEYHYNLLPEKHLTEYGTEQQAAIIQDYFNWTYSGVETCAHSLDLEYCNYGNLDLIKEIAYKRYLELQDI